VCGKGRRLGNYEKEINTVEEDHSTAKKNKFLKKKRGKKGGAEEKGKYQGGDKRSERRYYQGELGGGWIGWEGRPEGER